MKNRIWLGKNADGLMMASFKKIKINEHGMFQDTRTGTYAHCSGNTFGEFGANLECGQVIELEYDEATGEVRRFREIGWYLTERKLNEYAVARFWNGENWCCKPNERKTYETLRDEKIKVVSEIIRDNEYLKGLE